MAEYYKPYSAVSAVAPQFDTSALQRAGALFEKSLNSIRDKEIEDFKLAQEQEKYKNALGFQQRAEERDIAKIAEERAKTLATNNALAVMENPKVVTSLNTSASDATSQNALNMYNQANADGVVTPQEQALLDSTYQKDLTRDVLTSGSADQKSLFDARQAIQKLNMQEAENKANADYRAKALAQQAQSSNLQTKIYNDQRKAIEDQNNIAALILNSMKPIEKDVLNTDYVKVQDELNKATTNVSEFEKTNPNLVDTSLTPDIVNQFIEARNQKSLPMAMNGRIDPYGQGLISGGKVDSITLSTVNQKLLEAVGGNKDIYDTLVKSNNAEKFLQYIKDKGDLPKLNQNILTTPEKVKQVSPASLEDIRQAILNDPKTNASMKLNILNNLTDGSSGTGLGGLINTTYKSGKSGSTGIGELFDSNDDSVSDKRYKESKIKEAEVLDSKVTQIANKNPSIPKELVAEFGKFKTVAGREQFIKDNFNEDYTLKDGVSVKDLTLRNGLSKLVDYKEDTDNNTGGNINQFIQSNKAILSTLNDSELKSFISMVEPRYAAEGKSIFKNIGDNSPIGDALELAIKDWNKTHPDKKLDATKIGKGLSD